MKEPGYSELLSMSDSMNIETFSPEQLAGQRLMVGFDGAELDDTLMFLIDTVKVGGIILFSRNLLNPDQIKNLCRRTQEYARSCRQPPLFIAIDQEGGQVARLQPPFTQFPGNPSMRGIEDAAHFAGVTAFELSAAGLNMNMAPVLDVLPPGLTGVMNARAFGDNPEWVSRLGTTVIAHLQKSKIMAVAKHFPGIGRTTLDSHIERPVLDVDINEIQADLIPFKAALKSKVAGIMLAHIVYKGIDKDWPASLSVRIAKNLLREGLGFDGIIITDDLDMGAIIKNYDIGPIIERILLADIDIALICHPGPKIEAAFENILKIISAGPDEKIKCMTAVRRIMQFKREYFNL